MEANLESPLPATLPAGRGTAVFLYGRGAGELMVDGVRHAMTRAGGRFWGTATIPPRGPGWVELRLGEASLGRIEVVATPPPPVRSELIAICMATYDPDPALFHAQVASLRAQTHADWTCVISDDCSSSERYAELLAVVGDDPRFAVSRSERRAGFYRNFERALALAPPTAGLLALCDQDDVWYPEKLATLKAALRDGAGLAYCDQRLVDASGRVLRETLWRGRRNNHTDLASLLVANSVTGAATLFTRDVAQLALPFPDSPGLQFHDHWLGLVALAAGDVAYVDRPLYDYVQHRGAVFGEVTSGAARRSRRSWRGAYFLGYLGRVVQARALLVRCAPAPAKRRALERFVAAERSLPALAWLAARGLRPLIGRDETLGSELELVRGIAWRRLLPLRRAPDVSVPDPLAFEQRRLRRWRGA